MSETLVFQGSILSSLKWAAGELRIQLDASIQEPSYPDAHGGEPPRSPVLIVLTSPAFVRASHSITRPLADGFLELSDGQFMERSIPLPLTSRGACRLRLTFSNGEALELSGKGISAAIERTVSV